MARTKSSKRWLQEHEGDLYVQRARQEGYRSRASYKLLELHDKDRLFRPGMTVLDLGAAPGGWSQVAEKLVGHRGVVIASDILVMDTLAGVTFVQGDFTEDETYQAILEAIDGRPVDIVMSDMAPNMSGNKAIDQPRTMYLVELALDMAGKTLKRGGTFVVKVFHGEGFDDLVRTLRASFTRVVVRKPEASRSRSSEVYVVASGFQGGVE